MYSPRQASNNEPRQGHLQAGNMKCVLLNGGGGGSVPCSWLGSDLHHNLVENNGNTWAALTKCRKQNFSPAGCSLMQRRTCMQKQHFRGLQLRPQCPKGADQRCGTVKTPLKNSFNTFPPIHNSSGMFPTVVGLCCQVHALENQKPSALAAALRPVAMPRTYASAVKRPEGAVASSIKVPDQLKVHESRDTKLQKLTAATIRLATGQANPKPVIAQPVQLQNGRKSGKFNELKALLASSSANSSPMPSPVPGSGTRRTSIDYAVTCVVGTSRSSPKNTEYDNGSLPAGDSVSGTRDFQCNNPHIAFIMGLMCNDDDFEDDWDSDSDFEPEEPIIVTQCTKSDSHSNSKGDECTSNSPIVETVSQDHYQPKLNGFTTTASLIEANQKWLEAYSGPDNPISTIVKKVSFVEDDDLVTVHDIGESYDRKGPWEEFARDRCRFMRRIQDISLVLTPVLDPEHRQKVYEQRVVPSLEMAH